MEVRGGLQDQDVGARVRSFAFGWGMRLKGSCFAELGSMRQRPSSALSDHILRKVVGSIQQMD